MVHAIEPSELRRKREFWGGGDCQLLQVIKWTLSYPTPQIQTREPDFHGMIIANVDLLFTPPSPSQWMDPFMEAALKRL